MGMRRRGPWRRWPAAQGDHAAAARGDDHDAAAPGPTARGARGAQFERAQEFVEHDAGFELGERRADAAAHAAAEGQPRARGRARSQESVHPPLPGMRVDVGPPMDEQAARGDGRAHLTAAPFGLAERSVDAKDAAVSKEFRAEARLVASFPMQDPDSNRGDTIFRRREWLGHPPQHRRKSGNTDEPPLRACASMSRPSSADYWPSDPRMRLATRTCVCCCGSPARLVRCRNAAARAGRRVPRNRHRLSLRAPS